MTVQKKSKQRWGSQETEKCNGGKRGARDRVRVCVAPEERRRWGRDNGKRSTNIKLACAVGRYKIINESARISKLKDSLRTFTRAQSACSDGERRRKTGALWRPEAAPFSSSCSAWCPAHFWGLLMAAEKTGVKRQFFLSRLPKLQGLPVVREDSLRC